MQEEPQVQISFAIWIHHGHVQGYGLSTDLEDRLVNVDNCNVNFEVGSSAIHHLLVSLYDSFSIQCTVPAEPYILCFIFTSAYQFAADCSCGFYD